MPNMPAVQYWAEALQKNDEKIRSYTDTMLEKINSLSIEELYVLRGSLLTRHYIVFLNQALAEPDPKPRWKTLFRK